MFWWVPGAAAEERALSLGGEITYSFEAEKPWGIGIFVDASLVLDALGEPAATLGTTLSAHHGGSERWRLAHTAHGGVGWRGPVRPTVEGEAGVAFGPNHAVALQAGARLQGWGVATLRGYAFPLRNAAARDPDGALGWEVAAGLGWPFVGVHVMDGRPLREGDSAVLPRVALARAPTPTERRWIEQGRTEYASVFAFVRLARELAALGASGSLVNRSLHAAREEFGHAALCFGEAARSLGPIGVERGLPARPRPIENRTAGLARLAAEAIVDGVLGEGEAARRAFRAAESAASDRVARIHDRIGREESGHAELARDIAAWCATG